LKLTDLWGATISPLGVGPEARAKEDYIVTGTSTSVYGIYRNRVDLEDAVDMLLEAGFRNADISALLSDNASDKEFAHTKNTKGPEGTTTGTAIGGALGWLAGIGAVAIPGLGPFIVAGPIMGTLGGLGAGGAIGGIVGALAGMGIPEYEAKRYEGMIQDGGMLVSVRSHNSDWTRRAKELFGQTGAKDIGSASEGSADYAQTDRPEQVRR